ncbi:glycoside hydrolase family 97 catalytic domain-containing protein [Gracilibacillus sp. YIM 98692]|uniref:glycoside hydrolase family 97 catalytic domain-containing protein n=1 Tax=Gracilibacillus sp. YIM 98692 TaxID=2663532 RepID=UPI0013CF6375|nr:glycoside hydrolase family 97 catalytic domain-containing protein [Gracilibacillus sp. YIM 98692]
MKNNKVGKILYFLFMIMLVFSAVLSVQATPSSQSTETDTTTITSPNGKINLGFHLTDSGEPSYQLSYNDINIINPSNLGFTFKEELPLKNNFEIIKTTTDTFHETWEPVWGEKSEIKNHYNELTVYLQERETPKRKMNLIFRVFDDGIGFRYVLPEKDGFNSNQIEIMSEDTEFQFANNNTSWWIPNDWDSYEYNYTETPLSEVQEVSTPFTMKTPEGIHLTVHEAALIDYAGMALKAVDGKGNTLESYLAPWPDGVKVKKDTFPIETPWRTIEIGEDAGDLVESDMILNLNEPSKLEDTSWIEPLKYVGVWWEMISGKSTWASGERHGATTENAKRYIDFANDYLDTENQNIGLLVEGWNIGWDGNWIDNGDEFSFTESYPDYDLEEVVQYATDRNVSYIMHNETSGDILNYEEQMDDAYSMYQDLGIHAIKSGYVADHGIHNPEGQKHHGQYMVNHYNNAVKKAADYQIMINTHEPIKSTGLERTYPNWMSREGVMGMEYAAFGDENNPPEHDTILPFTRMMAGPIDFTPGIFDVEISHADTRVHSTRAKQLALYVTISTGTQMAADFPENYKDEDGNILPEFKFIKDVPVTWDDIMVPNAEIGDYATIVRRSDEEWYVGSITDENGRDLEVPLDFLDEGKKYVAEIYSDAADTDLETNPTAVSINKVIVKSQDTLTASLAAGGGQAVRIYPASKKEIAKLPNYKDPRVKVSYSDVPEAIQSNDEFEVKVHVRNKGNDIVGEKIELQIDGETVAENFVRVDPKSTKEVSLTYHKLFEPRDYQVQVNDLKPMQVTVNEKEPTFEFYNLDVIVEDQTITARADVVNLGTYAGEIEVPFYVDGKVVIKETIEVPAQAGGASKEVVMTYQPEESVGVYEVSIGDLNPKTIGLPSIEMAGEWLFQKGDHSSWKDADFDDTKWEIVTLPASWEDHSNYTEDNVYGWYRKTVKIPAEWEGHSLKVRLGRIDDVDKTYLNGELIGQSGTFPTGEGGEGMTTAWDWDREYVIPAEAIQYGEENVLSIRVFDASGGGGLYKGPIDPLEIFVEGEEQPYVEVPGYDDPMNKLVNGDFENGTTGWTLTGSGLGGVDANDAYEGSKYWIWYDDAYTAKVYQQVTELENGTYTVSAMVKQNNGIPEISRMELTGHGGDPVYTNIEHGDEYTQITETVEVTNGTLEIAFYQEALDEANLQIDNVTLTLVD